MKVKSRVLSYFHLDKTYSLMSAKSVKILLDIFHILDIHDTNVLNDIQFYCFVSSVTNLNHIQIYTVFDMLDVDGSGQLDFDEFYLFIAILVAVKDNDEKQFIYRHSRTVFDLLDEDSSNSISAREFEMFGFMFNMQGLAVKKIFQEFDVTGDAELDYKEFHMFAMACIDKQNELKREKKVKQDKRKKKREAASKRFQQMNQAAKVFRCKVEPAEPVIVQPLNPPVGILRSEHSPHKNSHVRIFTVEEEKNTKLNMSKDNMAKNSKSLVAGEIEAQPVAGTSNAIADDEPKSYRCVIV